MKPVFAAAVWLALTGMQAAPAPPPPDMALWRLDCGAIHENEPPRSPWRKAPLPLSCYLIKHGDRYLLWDAGLSARALGDAHPTYKLKRTIVDQLAEIRVPPDKIEFVGISHYHGDHTGQASAFPKAKLLIGAGDLAAYKAEPKPIGADARHLKPWLADGAPVEALSEDYDVFGDGRVAVLMTPGHTPGHSSLMVKLAGGTVMLSGDLWAVHGDALKGDMPPFNTSRAETLASRDRFARLAYKNDAIVILQHEVRDIDELPRFPEAAR